MLAAELPERERLIDDPFARLVVDDEAIAAARADVALQNVIRLRTRYIDDAVQAFAGTHVAQQPQVLLLGAGLDARAFRMNLQIDFYEVDFPATLELKSVLLAGHSPRSSRTLVPVDLATESFVTPLIAAGFDPKRPTVVVWEGVINYLSAATAESVVDQVAEILVPGGQIVADYVEMEWFKGTQLERGTATIAKNLQDGGEPLRGGLTDARATLNGAGFEIVDDEAIELLPPRYGLAVGERHYPARIFTAVRR